MSFPPKSTLLGGLHKEAKRHNGGEMRVSIKNEYDMQIVIVIVAFTGCLGWFDVAQCILPSTARIALRRRCFAQHQMALGSSPSTVVPLIRRTLRLPHTLALTRGLVRGTSFPRSLR